MKSIRYFHIIILGLILVGCSSDTKIDYSTYKTTIIKSNAFANKLYIRTEKWGLTGDKQRTYISVDNNIPAHDTTNKDWFLFKGLDPFFYKQSSDSLLVYCMANIKPPTNFKSKWKIVLYVVDNSTYMTMYEDSMYIRP